MFYKCLKHIVDYLFLFTENLISLLNSMQFLVFISSLIDNSFHEATSAVTDIRHLHCLLASTILEFRLERISRKSIIEIFIWYKHWGLKNLFLKTKNSRKKKDNSHVRIESKMRKLVSLATDTLLCKRSSVRVGLSVRGSITLELMRIRYALISMNCFGTRNSTWSRPSAFGTWALEVWSNSAQ